MRSHVLFIFVLLAGTVHGQWSTDPLTNVVIDDSSGEQVQPKIVAVPDGGYYVSWYDSDPSGTPAFGYDVRLQRLDVAGDEVWASGGVLVADRGFSSTQDYGLGIDATGAALLAFRDDRGSGVQITAARVDASGTLTWGVNGVQVTNTTDFVAAPKITGTTDGDVVVAWTQDVNAVLQRLDASGSPQWVSPVVYTPGAGSYSPSDLEAGDAGSAVLAFVHQTGGFGSPRHLLAQKLDTAGASLWPASHVAVFDGGSLQFGNFPTFVPDGAGGAVFSWYEVSPLTVRAQRVTPLGAEAFPHNGVTVSTDATRVRVNPSVAYDADSDETVVAWIEQNSLQSMFGLYAQKLDASGTRQWGSEGSQLLPLGGTQLGSARALISPIGSRVAYVQGPSFGSQSVRALELDNAGSTVGSATIVSSAASGKSRLAAASQPSGVSAYAWQDDRVDADGIYAQNLNPDGTLGDLGGPACFGVDANCPCTGGAANTGCDLAQATGGVELRVEAFAPDGSGGGQVTFSGNGFPAMGSPAAVMIRSTQEEDPAVVFGDGLRCVGIPLVRFGAAFATSGASVHTVGHGAGAGSFRYQIWFRNTPGSFCDPTAAFNLSNDYTLTWP